jgi:hypothetical protein
MYKHNLLIRLQIDTIHKCVCAQVRLCACVCVCVGGGGISLWGGVLRVLFVENVKKLLVFM